MDIELQHDAYGSNTIAQTTEHTMSDLNKHLDENPTPAPCEDNTDKERLELKSKWFSVKLEEINGYTLAAMAMILTALVIIVALLVPA
jgi:hypothetical protein